MNYTRREVDCSVIADMLGGGDVQLHSAPELPMIKFRKDKVDYEVTNLQILNEAAVRTFELCLSVAANNPEAERASFIVPDDYDEEFTQRVIDIVMGVSYRAKKKGRSGYEMWGSVLVTSCHGEFTDDGNRVVHFDFIKENANTIFEYAHRFSHNHSMNLCEIIVAIAKDTLKRWEESGVL